MAVWSLFLHDSNISFAHHFLLLTVVAMEVGATQSLRAFFVAASALFTETVACHPLHTPLQSQVHIALVAVINHHHYLHRGVYSSIICSRACLGLGASDTRQHTAIAACRALPQSSLSNLSQILFISLCFRIPMFVSCYKQQADKSVQLSPMGLKPCNATPRLPTYNKSFCNNLMTAFISLLWQRKIVVRKSSIHRTASGDVCHDSIVRNQHRSTQKKIPMKSLSNQGISDKLLLK